MIRMLQLEIWLWDDLLGAGGVELSIAPDLGVLGEDCLAMEVILAEEIVDRGWVGETVWNANGGEAFRLKTTPTAPILSGYERSNGEERQTFEGSAERVKGRPGGLDEGTSHRSLQR